MWFHVRDIWKDGEGERRKGGKVKLLTPKF